MTRPGVIIYVAGVVLAEALRVRWRIARLRSRASRRRPGGTAFVPEVIVMLAIVVGIWVLPFVYAFTGWLRSSDVITTGIRRRSSSKGPYW